MKFLAKLSNCFIERITIGRCDSGSLMSSSSKKTRPKKQLKQIIADNEEEILQVLKKKHPGYNINQFKLSRFPPSFWESQKNQRAYLDYLFIKLKYKSMEDWYNITNIILLQHRGRCLLSYYSSAFEAVKSIYKEHNWISQDSLSFPRTKSPKYWKDIEKQAIFFDSIFKELKYKSFNDWYSLQFENLNSKGGSAILKIYGSVFDALKVIYPNYPWDISKSTNRKRFSSIDIANFLLSIQKKFKVEKIDDWYRISNPLFRDSGFIQILLSLGGLRKLLNKQHPNINWKFNKFSEKSKKSVQRWLFILTSNYYANYFVIESYFYPSLRFPMGRWISFDIFIPELNIALEYDGEQHFEEVHQTLGFLEITQYSDKQKKIIAKENFIRLIKIPYWWDRTSPSLLPFLNITFNRD